MRKKMRGLPKWTVILMLVGLIFMSILTYNYWIENSENVKLRQLLHEIQNKKQDRVTTGLKTFQQKPHQKVYKYLEYYRENTGVIPVDFKLLNNPEVPFPAGWMNGSFLKHKPKVEVRQIGMKGMNYHGLPILIFDPPNTPKKKARFSVLDPPRTKSV